MLRLFALALTVVLTIFFNSCGKVYVAPSRDEAAYLDSLLENLDPNAESIFMQNAGQDARILNRTWQGIPSIGATKDSKEIYVTWYSGGRNEGAGNYITVALSLNKGKTWMNDKLIVFPADSGFLRFFDPCIWRDKNNNMWLTWAKSHNFWDGKGGVWTSRIFWDGKVIEHNDVEQLCKGILMNKPVHLLSQNAMLFPVSLWNLPPTDPANQGTFIYKAPYTGNKLKPDSLQLLSQLYVDDKIRTYDEHQVVELNLKGKMMCMVRTKEGIYCSLSMDFGKTWDKLRPFTGVGPTAASRFHITRLRSGKILLIANNSHDRTNLTAFLSSDEGKTWPAKMLLDGRMNVSYPDATQTTDGVIHVVYDRERFQAKEILYCKFKETDIPSSTFNLFKTIVNSH